MIWAIQVKHGKEDKCISILWIKEEFDRVRRKDVWKSLSKKKGGMRYDLKHYTRIARIKGVILSLRQR